MTAISWLVSVHTIFGPHCFQCVSLLKLAYSIFNDVGHEVVVVVVVVAAIVVVFVVAVIVVLSEAG